jgi:arylsulfatase A-like enzyme
LPRRSSEGAKAGATAAPALRLARCGVLKQPLRNALAAAVLALALSACADPSSIQNPKSTFQNPPRRPNIVFILADDLGWRDTGVYGSRFCETPHIDRLAAGGMRFTRAYAAPLCSPTRASVLTGLHTARHGITGAVGHVEKETLEPSLRTKAQPGRKFLEPESATRLRLEHVTLAEALRGAGYATGHFGKWHLGRAPYGAAAQGFDTVVPAGYWAPGPPGAYLAPWRFPKPGEALPGKPGDHIEDRLATEAIAFMRANRDRPFFLNYWAFSVHGPWGGKPELIEKYRARVRPDDPQKCPTYGAMVQSLDENVGRLAGALGELGIADRTIVVFVSDNGGNMYSEVGGVPPTSNAPLRAGKATVYEGGTRVPCIVAGPGVARPGTVSDAFVSVEDFFPTLLELAGVPAPAKQTLDGMSFAPVLRGGPGAREAVYTFFPHDTEKAGGLPATAVRAGDWKLIRFHCGGDALRPGSLDPSRDKSGQGGADRHELYNLKDDIGEARDLAAAEPERVAELGRRIDRFLKDTGALLPKPNPDYVPGR